MLQMLWLPPPTLIRALVWIFFFFLPLQNWQLNPPGGVGGGGGGGGMTWSQIPSHMTELQLRCQELYWEGRISGKLLGTE